MGGYSQPLSESLGLPQDLATPMRRRGLIPALAQIQPQQPAGTDRVADDPVTRANPEAYGATSSGQSPVSASSSNPLTDKMWEEYNRLGQPEPAPPQPSLKQRLLSGLLRAAPIAAGAIAAGGYGARGAAQGTVQEMNREQGINLAQRQMAQQHEQQRNSLRERMLQEILQQQRMEQQNQQFNQREQQRSDLATQAQRGQEQRLGERITAGQQEQQEREKASQAATQSREDFQREQQTRQFQQQIDQQQRQFGQQMAMQGRQFGEQEKLIGMRQQAQQQQLTPATQGILQATDPAKQMVDDLITKLEPYKNSDKRLTMNRIGYALGMKSPENDLARDISELELNRVMGAARVLKGSSRAYQALERAMVHTPNPWVDTTGLMYDKLQTLRKNLEDVEQDAIRFGTKGQTAASAQSQLGQPTGSRAGGAPLTVDEARQYLQRAGGDKERARALAKQDGRTF